jgi:hypothetical protein
MFGRALLQGLLGLLLRMQPASAPVSHRPGSRFTGLVHEWIAVCRYVVAFHAFYSLAQQLLCEN